MKISARKLMNIKPIEVFENFVGDGFELVFDDGSVHASGMQITLSRYAWEMLKPFPHIPFSKSYFIGHYTPDKNTFTAGAMSNLMSNIMHTIFDHYQMDNEAEVRPLQSVVWQSFMDINNLMHNDMYIYGNQYNIALNVEDLLDVYFDPDIVNIDLSNPIDCETVKIPNYVDDIYKQKQKVILSDKHKQNNLSIMMRAGAIKLMQFMQCEGPRGLVTDMNSTIFKEPIKGGYLDGLNLLYDRLIESRTAAMSLYNQSDPLKFTEYFSRRVQFLGMYVKNLHFGDCGSRNYLQFQVREKREGYKISDLELFEGMNYLVEEESTPDRPVYRQLRKTDKHLIGKILKFRTVFGCMHTDPQGVCSVCIGAISRSMPKWRNIGHTCVVVFTEIVSQKTLSTKHFTASAVSLVIPLTEYQRRFFNTMNDGLTIGLRKELYTRYKKISLFINVGSETQYIDIGDVGAVKDVQTLSPKKTSSINTITLRFTDFNDETTDETMDIIPFNNRGFLSIEMLKHIKKHGWQEHDKGRVLEFDLTKFKPDTPLIEIESRQTNMFRYAKSLEKILKPSAKELKVRAIDLTPEKFLMDFSDAINTELGINMSVISVVAYSVMGVDLVNKDYSLPKPWTRYAVGDMDRSIAYRSLSTAYSYERQANHMSDPNSFITKNRMDSPFDEFFTPDQMELDYRKI